MHYGWVMVIIAIFVLAIETLTICAFGIFLIPITTEFGWDRGEFSGVLTVMLIVAGFLGILTGRLSDKYGPRIPVTIGGIIAGGGFLLLSIVSSLWQVYLVWGLFIGIGTSCIYIPTLSTIPKWFAKNSGVAMGLTATGLGIGGIVTPILAQWLISSYGWQQALIILGIIILIIVAPIAQFMKHSPQMAGLSPYGANSSIKQKQSSPPTIKGFHFNKSVKTVRFWILGSIIFFFLFAVQIVSTHFVPLAVDNGIHAILAASILSIIAATSIIGRNLVGFVCDKVGTKLTLIASLSMLTLSLIWLFFTKELWTFYVFAILFGIAYGGIIPVRTLIVAEIFGHKSLGTTLGSVTLFGTVGSAIGPLVAGSVYDVTGSYNLAILICTVICALSIILTWILYRIKM